MYLCWILSCDNLVKIILQFDIILIQEVLDKTEKSLFSLLEAVNNGVTEAGDARAASHFRLISSPRLGRAEPREQYAFFYRLITTISRLMSFNAPMLYWFLLILSVRAERVSVVDSDVYPDQEEDTFISLYTGLPMPSLPWKPGNPNLGTGANAVQIHVASQVRTKQCMEIF